MQPTLNLRSRSPSQPDWSGRPVAALAMCLLPSLGLPGEAVAQSNFRLRPSLELIGGWDDNLLSTPQPAEKDWMGRVTPGLEATVTGPRSVFGLRYGAEAEGFADHPELAAAPAAQNAEAWLDFDGSRWSSETRGSYAETNRPWELNVATGLAAGRIEGRRTEAHQVLGHRFGPRTKAIADYNYRLEELTGDVRGDIHVGRLGLERRFSPRDVVSYSYALRRFAFKPGGEALSSGGEGAPVTTHVLTIGWERALSPGTVLKLEAGPRFGDGGVHPEGAASLRHTSDRGEMSLGYSQTQTTILGESDVAVTDEVGASLSHRLVSRLTIYLAPGWFWTRVGDREARVWRTDAELRWQVTPYLLIAGAHALTYETGDLGRAEGGEVIRNLFMLRLRIIPAPSVRRASK